MKWQGRGEFKALASLTDIVRLNAGTDKTEAAILLGKSPTVALETVLDTPHPHRREFRFDSVFPCVHFVPMDENGVRQLKIMAVPNWKERILDALPLVLLAASLAGLAVLFLFRFRGKKRPPQTGSKKG